MTDKLHLSNPSNIFGDAQSFLKMIPCPAGLWTQDRSLCLLNAQAISLLSFQDSDFDDARHLWAQQVHAGDRDRYLDFSRRVGDNHGPQSCDYRFLPKGATKHVSLRETSDAVTTVALSSEWQVISTYIEISDLKSQPPVNGRRARLDDIIDELFHDAQNGIHRVGMELELARMGLENGSDAAQTTEMINVLEHTVRDLRGYISSMQSSPPDCDPAAVLDAVVANRQMGGLRRRVNITWIPPESVPLVTTHAKLLARVFERILDVCENLMQQGGELRIAAGQRQRADRFRVEIKLTMLSSVPIPNEASREFLVEPADKNPNRRGINRALDVLRRHQGEISFRRDSDRQCELTILL